MVRWTGKSKSFKEIEDVIEPFRRRLCTPLSEKCPALALEWCYAKNCGWGPEDFGHASTVKAWWICSDCNREYKAIIKNRSNKGSGCPYCASKLACDDNSLSVLFPSIAKQWHPTKNDKDKPSQFTKASSKSVWWQCPKSPDHVWKAAISTRTNSESDSAGCPFCHGLRTSKTNSLQAINPTLSKEWHPTKNGELQPTDVTANSNRKVWWLCKTGHSWKQAPDVRNGNSNNPNRKGNNCPFCSNQRVAKDKSLAVLFPKTAEEWHPTKNGILKPKHVVPGSNKKVWWLCRNNSDHEWKQNSYERTSSGAGCPYCTNRIVASDNCLAAISPALASQWHPTKNGTVKPTDILAGTNKKYWWKCDKGLDHEWEQSPHKRLYGRNCPFCAGKKVSVTNSLAECFPGLAAEWHPERNGDLTPHDITFGSGKMVWWQCKRKHVWQTTPSRRTFQGLKPCALCREIDRK